MKTNVIMKRSFDLSVISQNSKDGFFNLNEAHKIANRHRIEDNLSPVPIQNYFDSPSSKEFITELSKEVSIPIEDLKRAKRGKGGGTYVHPYILIDYFMWACPKLKVKILGWVHDNLIEYRNASGNSFKEMNKVLSMAFDLTSETWIFSKVANRIADACQVGKGSDRWQHATEDQLKMRNELQENIKLLAASRKFKSYEDVVETAIRLTIY